LTPEHPDGAPWCLVSPPDRPALLQAPVPSGSLADWKKQIDAPDALDLLQTSKNHDVKAERALACEPDDWIFALVSLQTQEGGDGRDNHGISRMNKAYGSRPGVGAQPVGRWGAIWLRDTSLLLAERGNTAELYALDAAEGHALLWLLPWDGNDSLNPARLDPHYIEVCRRLRLCIDQLGRLNAKGTGSKLARIAAKELNGVTGDLWTPVDLAAGKALTITGKGFDYELAAMLLMGGKYRAAPAQQIGPGSATQSWVWVARGLVRGQGKTEGFHERRVPLSPRMRSLLASNQQALLASVARERVDAIGSVRKLLWQALLMLFNNGSTGQDASDPVKDKAGRFSKTFEREEDARFFTDLTDEIEADHAPTVRLRWLIGITERAEAHLLLAFDAGPRSAMRRYRARSAALSRWRSGLRGSKSPLPALAEHYRQQNQTTTEEAA
jgi:CRISPR system Cascade subunit CasA